MRFLAGCDIYNLESHRFAAHGRVSCALLCRQERAVDRRLQTLQRFLLEQLHRESSGRQGACDNASQQGSCL